MPIFELIAEGEVKGIYATRERLNAAIEAVLKQNPDAVIKVWVKWW